MLLKRKIMIKNKRLKPEVEKIELELFQQGQLALDNEEPAEDASAAPNPAKLAAEAAAPESEGAPAAALPGQSQEGEGAEVPINYTGSTTNVHPWLSSMINYAQPIKFVAFDAAESKNLAQYSNYFNLQCISKFISQRKTSIIICRHSLKRLA